MTDPFAAMMREMPKIPAPTCYLDHDALSMEARGLRYAEMLRLEIEQQGPENVLAFIMEPIGGASTGALVAPDSYYRRVREICDQYGILLIADEVMTGAGRTGRFLASDHWQLRPDLIALSKGFAAGYAPLGVMAARDDIVETVLDHGGFVHGYTYAGNPLACAAGVAVLAEIDRLDLCQRAQSQGEKQRQLLLELQNKHPIIGDVRGMGLLMAIELMADPVTKEPLPPELNAHSELVERAYRRGLILYSRRTRGGTLGDHLMICPPLIISDRQLEELASKLDDALTSLAHDLNLPQNRG